MSNSIYTHKLNKWTNPNYYTQKYRLNKITAYYYLEYYFIYFYTYKLQNEPEYTNK